MRVRGRSPTRVPVGLRGFARAVPAGTCMAVLRLAAAPIRGHFAEQALPLTTRQGGEWRQPPPHTHPPLAPAPPPTQASPRTPPLFPAPPPTQVISSLSGDLSLHLVLLSVSVYSVILSTGNAGLWLRPLEPRDNGVWSPLRVLKCSPLPMKL